MASSSLTPTSTTLNSDIQQIVKVQQKSPSPTSNNLDTSTESKQIGAATSRARRAAAENEDADKVYMKEGSIPTVRKRTSSGTIHSSNEQRKKQRVQHLEDPAGRDSPAICELFSEDSGKSSSPSHRTTRPTRNIPLGDDELGYDQVNVADRIEDCDDKETQLAKSEILKAKTEAQELKTCVENVITKYFDIKLQELDMQIDLIRQGTHPEFISGLQQLEKIMQEKLVRADNLLKITLEQLEIEYDAANESCDTSLVNNKRLLTRKTMERLSQQVLKLKAEYNSSDLNISVPRMDPKHLANKRKLALEYASSAPNGLAESAGDVPYWTRGLVRTLRHQLDQDMVRA